MNHWGSAEASSFCVSPNDEIYGVICKSVIAGTGRIKIEKKA
jgi:hypothetical protein